MFGPGEEVQVFLICIWSDDLLSSGPSFGQVAVPSQPAPLEGQMSADVGVERVDGVGGVPPLLAMQHSGGSPHFGNEVGAQRRVGVDQPSVVVRAGQLQWSAVRCQNSSAGAAFACRAAAQEVPLRGADPQDRFPALGVLVVEFGQRSNKVRRGHAAVKGQSMQRRGVHRDRRVWADFHPVVRARSMVNAADQLKNCPCRASVSGGKADQVGTGAFAVDRAHADRQRPGG